MSGIDQEELTLFFRALRKSLNEGGKTAMAPNLSSGVIQERLCAAERMIRNSLSNNSQLSIVHAILDSEPK